jgi:hypothetical protein
MADALLVAPTVAFAAATAYATAVATTEPDLVGEPLGLRPPGRVWSHLLLGWGSAISAPWPMAVIATWAASRGTQGSARAASTVALVGAGILAGTLAEPVTWGRRPASSLARASIPVNLAIGAAMLLAGTHRLRQQATAVP